MRSCISLVIGYNFCRSWIEFRKCKTYEKTSENSDPEINGRDRSARLAQMVEIALVYGTGHNRLRLMRNTVDCIQLRNRNFPYEIIPTSLALRSNFDFVPHTP